MQGVLKQQEDYAWGRQNFVATDHEFLMMGVYVNVYKGFVPQKCLPMPDAAAVGVLCRSREGYKYEMAISAVQTGVLPESVIFSVKRLMEFLKGHIVVGDQSNPLRGALASKCIEEQGSTMVRLTRCP